jgi:alcohol dehydrogenase class IV
MAAVLANRASQSTFNTQGRARTTGIDRILRYEYPHIGQGASNAVLLPSLLRLNKDVAPEEQARLTTAMGAKDPAQFIESFLEQIGAPTRLRDLQVPRGDVPRLARLDIEAPAFGQGPNRISDMNELTRFLEGAW